MTVLVFKEEDLKDKQIKIDDDSLLFYIKLIGIGNQSLSKCDYYVNNLLNQVSGYYISGTSEELGSFLSKNIIKAIKSQEDLKNEGSK